MLNADARLFGGEARRIPLPLGVLWTKNPSRGWGDEWIPTSTCVGVAVCVCGEVNGGCVAATPIIFEMAFGSAH